MCTPNLFYLPCDDDRDYRDYIERALSKIGSLIPSTGEQDKKFCVIGSISSSFAEVWTLPEYFIHLYRTYNLHQNERETVINEDDQMILLQLCLAEKNKQETGDFDVEVSKVVEVKRRLVQEKMGLLGQHETEDCLAGLDYQKIVEDYHNYMRTVNMVDFASVFSKVRDEHKQNEGLQKQLASTDIVLINCTDSVIEKCMLEFLCMSSHRAVQVLLQEEPLETVSQDTTHWQVQDSTLQEVLLKCADSNASVCKRSVTEIYTEGVLLSYLQLLVNSRAELALARILNVPDRGLDHKAFTDLKKAAKQRKMSLYQTAISFIMRIRLGGKSYAPDPDCPLAQHVKGLSEFTDLMQKLQTILEEDPNTSSACRRIVNILKATILKSKENNLRQTSVEAVVERIHHQVAKAMNAVDTTMQDSPQRSASAGGSLLGRKVVRVFRQLLDVAAGQSTSHHAVEVLGDNMTSQKTPVRLPSLLAKFRSPEEEESDARINTPLAERLKAKFTKKKKPAVVRYQSTMDWAKPLHHIGLPNKEDELVVTDVVASKTLVCPGESKPRPLGTAKKVLESINDQENMYSSSTPTTSPVSSSIDKAPPRKRFLGAGENKSLQPVKKTKVSQPKASKKKVAPLEKGQKKLTAFFRI